MAKRSAFDELDEAVQAMIDDPDGPVPTVHPRLAALLQLAADLRDLPRQQFKDRLEAALAAQARRLGGPPPPPSESTPIVTAGDLRARLHDMAGESKLVAHDLTTALSGLPEMAMRFLVSLNECTVGVSRFSTQVPLWECHPAGDELLHVLEGALEVTTMTDEGPVQTTVPAGSVFVCPRGLWHWPRPLSPVSLLFATPGEGSQNSRSAQPPRRGRGRRSPSPAATTGRAIVGGARDVRTVLSSVPELRIGTTTTRQDADAAFGTVASFNRTTLTVGRFVGETPWERHPDGDELLHVLDGKGIVTVLTDDGPVRVPIRAGSVFVCPQGLWHRQNAPQGVTTLYATPLLHGEVSFADDPR